MLYPIEESRPERSEQISENLQRLHEEINENALAAGRRPGEITLIAVSKTYPPADLLAAAAVGQTLFGENKVQELCAKVEALAEHPQIKIHLIGTLQRNKVKDVVGKTELIHSVHKLSLLQALEKEAEKKDCIQDVLLQLNIAREASKHGFLLEEEEAALSFVQENCPHLRLRGYMCMAPYFVNREEAFPVFAKAREVFERRQQQCGEESFSVLSMGMSHDYPVAIRAGATHLRIGSAIFGARDYSR